MALRHDSISMGVDDLVVATHLLPEATPEAPELAYNLVDLLVQALLIVRPRWGRAATCSRNVKWIHEVHGRQEFGREQVMYPARDPAAPMHRVIDDATAREATQTERGKG